MYDTPKKSLKLTQAQAQTQTKIHRRTYPGQVTAVLEHRLEDSRSERGKKLKHELTHSSIPPLTYSVARQLTCTYMLLHT